MKRITSSLLQICLVTLSYLHINGKITSAQVTPDNTVNTQVERSGNVSEITGGATRGDNLFHSFEQFSIPNGNEAFFNNASAISNIFSRVTGGSISEINGLIRANGGANLYLINPAGIIFGENASLNIGGSFYGSSASSIVFPNSEFSAIFPEDPILTISVPIGLSFENNPGEVVNNSAANRGRGLEVIPGSNITLVGGNVRFNNGNLTAPDGTINLGGLEAEGTVEIKNNGSLTFPQNIARGDVTLTNGSIVYVARTGKGSININAGYLEMSAGELGSSFMAAGVTNNSTNSQAGDININATGNIAVDNSSIENGVASEAIGNAGNIKITTGSLSLMGGGQIRASIDGDGNAGGIEIVAKNNVSIDGERSDGSFPSGVGSQVAKNGKGEAGDLNITADSLFLESGGTIRASTEGRGNAGGIEILVEDTISINGLSLIGSFPSAVGSQVFPGAKGNAGDIRITTDSLFVTNNGLVSASTAGQGNAGGIEIMAQDTISIDGQNNNFFSTGVGSQVVSGAKGNAGDIRITTDSLFVTNNGLVSASTAGQGNAGGIEIMAQDTILIDSQSLEDNPSGIGSVAIAESQGDAGDIRITTDSLFVINGGLVSTSAEGQNNAGALTIKANSLNLDDNALIGASTTSEDGGNINLIVAEDIILKNNSTISARAFEDANGGNVTIDAGVIIAFPNQNNDIIASADQGRGGRIDITSEGVFGLEERSSIPENNTNDFDASSQLGINGTVQINTPEVSIQKELEQLEGELVVTDTVVANSCLSPSNQQGSFTISGNAGLPKNPDSNYSDVDFSLTGINLPNTIKQPVSPQSNYWQQNSAPSSASEIVRSKDGRVFLIAALQNAESLFCQS